MTNIQILDSKTIRIETDIERHQFEIYTGYFGQQVARNKPEMAPINETQFTAIKRTAEQNVRAAEAMIATKAIGCPCCKSVA